MMPTPPHDDTQWARYEVFQQTRPGVPLANIGSVHAPDPEMALQNARDVFVRRPQTHVLWVVPADVILSRTAEEIARGDWQSPESAKEAASSLEKRFFVFRKSSQRRSMTFVTQSGEVQARSASEALRLALQRFSDDKRTFVWWIVPADAVVTSQDEDVPSMFDPAHDKRYRMPAEYHTQTMMRELEEQDDPA